MRSDGAAVEAAARARFLDTVGRENIMPNIQTALDRAKEVYAARVDAMAN